MEEGPDCSLSQELCMCGSLSESDAVTIGPPPAALWTVVSVIPLGYQKGEASTSKGSRQLPLRRPGMALPLNPPHGSGCTDRAAPVVLFSLHCEEGRGARVPRPSVTLSSDLELDSRVRNPASCRKTDHFSKKDASDFQCLMTYYGESRGEAISKILKGTSPGLPPLVEISKQDVLSL